MKILLDQTFPSDTPLQVPITHECHRWSAGDADDLQLIEYARKLHFDLLVLIGRQVLARSEIRVAVDAAGIGLAVTHETSPQLARAHFLNHLATVDLRLRGRRFMTIYAGRVELHST